MERLDSNFYFYFYFYFFWLIYDGLALVIPLGGIYFPSFLCDLMQLEEPVYTLIFFPPGVANNLYVKIIDHFPH
jgi:hypothetical protein